MSWDSDRVRIELCDVMSIDPDMLEMAARQAAEIWLSDDQGKIRRTRKPVVTLVDETRPALLRQIADWMENKDDPSLAGLAAEYARKRTAT